MVRVNRLLPPSHAAEFAKCEYFQPLNSVKDRIGVAVFEAGEKEGEVHAGTRTIEATNGKWLFVVLETGLEPALP